MPPQPAKLPEPSTVRQPGPMEATLNTTLSELK
jgi:hypothetical protein